jgi:hypothetical protein
MTKLPNPTGNSPWQNVKDFGATGDGTTDDTAALASALATRGVIYFPPGVYAISSELDLAGVRAIIGDSAENDNNEAVSVIRQTNPKAHGLHGQNLANFTMRNIRLEGPGSGSGHGLLLDGPAVSWYIHLEDVRIQKWGGDGVNAFAVVSTFTNVLAMDNGRHGFTFDGLPGGAAATSISLIGCFARGNQAAGYHLYNMTYCSLSGCAADFNGIGYWLDTCAAISMHGCGCESPVNRSAAYPGTGYKIVGGNGVSLAASFLAGNLGVGWSVSGNSNVTLISPAEILPAGSATVSINVDAGSHATVIGPAVVTAPSYADGSATVIGAPATPQH